MRLPWAHETESKERVIYNKEVQTTQASSISETSGNRHYVNANVNESRSQELSEKTREKDQARYPG